MNTDAINHDPAITFIQSGSQQPGRPSMGAWVSYGLGSENQNLPSFVVMVSQASGLNIDQPLFSRLWGPGFLPSKYQGVKFRAGSDPVLYLSDPPGIDKGTRRRMLDGAGETERHARAGLRRSGNRDAHRAVRDGVPDADLGAGAGGSFERTASTFSSCTARIPASPGPTRGSACWRGAWRSATCGSSRFTSAAGISITICRAIWRCSAKSVDQPSAALVQDLKQRGLLDDTLVIWGGEFGRTVYCQGKLMETNYGRDHHPRCFTMWMAGGGIKPGTVLGETDDYCYNVVSDPVHDSRFAGDDPALPGRGSQAADVQVPGPAFPADGRGGGRGEEAAGLVHRRGAETRRRTAKPPPLTPAIFFSTYKAYKGRETSCREFLR